MPATDSSLMAPAEAATGNSQVSSNAPKILVVDDCPVNRKVLASLISRGGYRVETADSGFSALKMLEGSDFELLMLDLEMDDMDGLEVLELLRKDDEFKDLPILMVSALSESSRMVEALDLGANDYLIKPVDPALLLAKVRRNLRTRQASAVPGPLAIGTNLEAGTRLGHYEIVSLLGEGSMGQVYCARDVRLLRNVAVKVLQGGRGDVSQRIRLFQTEALAVARISHPNVVAIYDIGMEPFPFMAMELVMGRCMSDPSWTFPFEASQAILWSRQMLSGLAAAHAQNVIHRDLKPENIMVMPNSLLKLMDFGIAKLLEHEDPLQSKRGVGTPQFMSPEQADRSFGPVGPQSDLFAVAGLLYLMLTGSVPFPAVHPAQQMFAITTQEPRPIRELNSMISPALEAACMRGLRKEPAERFASAEEFSRALVQASN